MLGYTFEAKSTKPRSTGAKKGSKLLTTIASVRGSIFLYDLFKLQKLIGKSVVQ